MNPHKAADVLVGYLGGLYGDRVKFFRDGAKGPHLFAVIDETVVALDFPKGDGKELHVGREYEVSAGYRKVQTTSRCMALRWRGPDAPTLIYHHGSGQTDYTARIRRIAARMHGRTGNIIAGSVPYNRTMKECLFGSARLDRFAFMLAASVRLTEALDHLFTGTIYRKLLARSARGANKAIRRSLNFEGDFCARGNENVFPVMARHDQFIRFERQSHAYQRDRMTVLDRGHTTGTIAYRQLAAHLESVLVKDTSKTPI